MRIISALVLVSLSAVVACSSSSTSGPTNQQAYQEFYGAYCQRLTDCFAASGYATPVADCVQKALGALSNPSAPSACTQAQVDACATDTKNIACAATPTAMTLPSSCNVC